MTTTPNQPTGMAKTPSQLVGKNISFWNPDTDTEVYGFVVLHDGASQTLTIRREGSHETFDIPDSWEITSVSPKKYLTILTDGKNFIAPEISTQSEVEARERAAKDMTGYNNVIAIPISVVMASPQLLDVAKQVILNSAPAALHISGNMTLALAQAAIADAGVNPVDIKLNKFSVGAYKPAGENPVLVGLLDGFQIMPVVRRGEPAYNLLLSATREGALELKWLFGQSPQPLE